MDIQHTAGPDCDPGRLPERRAAVGRLVAAGGARGTSPVFDTHLADPRCRGRAAGALRSGVRHAASGTPLTRAILERLPKLKLICSTALRNASIDLKATSERSIPVATTGYDSTPTVELTWALILSAARHIPAENAALREGGWQRSVGVDLAGKTLGMLGLGKTRLARRADRPGLRHEDHRPGAKTSRPTRAAEFDTEHVSKQALFGRADFLTIHLVLSKRTRGTGQRRRTRADEARCVAGQHLARADPRRGGVDRRPDRAAHRRRGDRCLRHGAAAGGPIPTGRSRICWRRRISATSRSGCTGPSTAIRCGTSSPGSTARTFRRQHCRRERDRQRDAGRNGSSKGPSPAKRAGVRQFISLQDRPAGPPPPV